MFFVKLLFFMILFMFFDRGCFLVNWLCDLFWFGILGGLGFNMVCWFDMFVNFCFVRSEWLFNIWFVVVYFLLNLWFFFWLFGYLIDCFLFIWVLIMFNFDGFLDIMWFDEYWEYFVNLLFEYFLWDFIWVFGLFFGGWLCKFFLDMICFFLL